MVAEALGLLAVALVGFAEWRHARRTRRIAHLAFGPRAQPRAWVHAVPLVTAVAFGAVTWGLVTLWQLDPKVHQTDAVDETQIKQLLVVLDVSPSMLLEDAGPSRDQQRRQRASDVVRSMINRLPIREYRVSLVAFYNGAKPLLQESNDFEILRHIFEDLPTFLGFEAGKTDLFAGLQLAAETAKPWRPGSATLLLISDGVSAPGVGMPRLPASVGNVLVIGVGDPYVGSFIDGHQSRQDTANLRQIANRLKGHYHNGNIKHLPSDVLAGLKVNDRDTSTPWSRRELALGALAGGASWLALIPALLHWCGTGWKAGVRVQQQTVSGQRVPLSRRRGSVPTPAPEVLVPRSTIT